MQQLAYGALITGRVSMVVDSGNMSKKALVIAIRYGLTRRQFGAKPGQEETLLMDYPIHQYRLMPLLAQAYAMHFTGKEVQRIYDKLMQTLESLNPDDKQGMHEAIEQLKAVHGTSAGLKAFCTWNCLNTIDQCRQACGGHGYSAYTGLASMYSDFAVQCTWEGDNTILTLQAGRYLISCYRESQSGKKQHGGVAYLNDLATLIKSRSEARTAADLLDLKDIGKAYHAVSAHVIQKAGQAFEQARQKGLKDDEAYEECCKFLFHPGLNNSYSTNAIDGGQITQFCDLVSFFQRSIAKRA
jgi:acyl-CoA oxidase